MSAPPLSRYAAAPETVNQGRRMSAVSACQLAVSLWALPVELGRIFYFIVLPMLLIIGLGYFLQRRMGLDMPTLVKLNFYFIIPAIIYYSLVTADISLGDVGVVLGFQATMMILLVAAASTAAVLRRVPRDQRNALLMTVMFYNSGNYGLTLQRFAFGGSNAAQTAVSLQTFVMIFQNLTTFTLGIALAASGGVNNERWRRQLLRIVRFPPIYALSAGLITIAVRRQLGDQAADLAAALAPFWSAIEYIANAFFAIALMTLGAQLAAVPAVDSSTRYPVKLSVALRLLLAPAIGLGVIYAFGLTGFVAQVLLISTATPTAVNCMLMCMEFDNHPAFVARSVFYSTLLSPITVTLTVFLAKGGLIARLTLGG